MRKNINRLIGVSVSALLLVGIVHAQSASQTPVAAPAAMAPASKDPAAAPAGNYKIDLEHSSVVARVPHRGMSYNVLRFGVREGVLRWDAAKPTDINLNVTVDAKPYYAPIVYKILPEGPQSLDVAQFPEMKFVSTAIRVKGNGRATIEGNLTLMGVTKPATIDAELAGVGKSMEGASTVGFTGTMIVNTADFTDKMMAKMVGKATIILDAEFIKG